MTQSGRRVEELRATQLGFEGVRSCQKVLLF